MILVSQKHRSCQEKKQTSFNTTNEKISKVESLGRIARTIVNMVIHKSNTWKNCFVSHGYIANEIGCSPSYVQEVLRWAKVNGILTYKRRFNSSNVYVFPKWLREVGLEDRLANILPALRGVLCISMLLTCSMLGNNFFSQKNQPMEKPVLYKSYNESKNLDSNICKPILEKVTQNEPVKVTERVATKTIDEEFPFLDDSGKIIAAYTHSTPYKAIKYSLLPKEITDLIVNVIIKVNKSKCNVQSRTRFYGSLIWKTLQDNNIEIDYTFVNSIAHRFGIQRDREFTWIDYAKMEQQVAGRLRKREELQRDLSSKPTKAKSPEVIESEEKRLKRQSDELVAKRRKNPNAKEYDGPLTTQRYFGSKAKELEQQFSISSVAVSSKTPQEVPPAPPVTRSQAEMDEIYRVLKEIGIDISTLK